MSTAAPNTTPLSLRERLDGARLLVMGGTGFLGKVFIGLMLDRYPDQLSQGERQRVAVCRALLVNPPLLLADEPTGNLDPANKQRVLDTLFELVEDSEATLVTVTHDRELVPRFDRVIDFDRFDHEVAG